MPATDQIIVPSEGSQPVKHPNSLIRALQCGLIVFIVYFGITSWRHQGDFDVGYAAIRYGLHVLVPVLLVAYVSRRKAWSYAKGTATILLVSVILLFVTGIKSFLESGEKAKIHEQQLELLCSEAAKLTSTLESMVRRTLFSKLFP